MDTTEENIKKQELLNCQLKITPSQRKDDPSQFLKESDLHLVDNAQKGTLQRIKKDDFHGWTRMAS